MAGYNYCEQDARVSTGIINLALFRGQGSSMCTMHTHTSWIYTFESKIDQCCGSGFIESGSGSSI